MRTRQRVVVRRTYYVPPDWAEGFKTFTNHAISEAIQYAIISRVALAGQTRDDIIRRTPGLGLADAPKAARRLIEEGGLDQYRLRYMKSLPPGKQLELFKDKKIRHGP